MESPHILLTVSLIWAIAAITPGPNFFITVHTAVGKTRRLSLCTVAGIVAGTFIWAVSGFMGVTVLFRTLPVIYYGLKIIGGVYLIYIGIRLLVFNKRMANPPTRKPATAFSCFRFGLYTNLLNPKTAAFMTSLFAATIPADASIELGALCILCIGLVSAAWYSFVSLMFSHERAQNAYTLYRSHMERIAGALFIGFGSKLATTE